MICLLTRQITHLALAMSWACVCVIGQNQFQAGMCMSMIWHTPALKRCGIRLVLDLRNLPVLSWIMDISVKYLSTFQNSKCSAPLWTCLGLEMNICLQPPKWEIGSAVLLSQQWPGFFCPWQAFQVCCIQKSPHSWSRSRDVWLPRFIPIPGIDPCSLSSTAWICTVISLVQQRLPRSNKLKPWYLSHKQTAPRQQITPSVFPRQKEETQEGCSPVRPL